MASSAFHPPGWRWSPWPLAALLLPARAPSRLKPLPREGLRTRECGLRIMSSRWCHVAQTKKKRYLAQRRREEEKKRRREGENERRREGEKEKRSAVKTSSNPLSSFASLRLCVSARASSYRPSARALPHRNGFRHHFEATPLAARQLSIRALPEWR
jgi:hypothetical protein